MSQAVATKPRRTSNRGAKKVSEPQNRSKSGSWVGSGKPGPGRKKGVPNRVTQDVREMVIVAANLVGQDVLRAQLEREGMDYDKALEHAKKHGTAVDYLRQQAHENPKAFMSLLGKTMPTKLDVDVHVMTAELADKLTQRRDQLARMRAERDAKTIEHIP